MNSTDPFAQNSRGRPVAALDVGLSIVVALVAACAPPAAVTTKTWSFETRRVVIDKSQDKTVLGLNNSDDVYTVNIAFRVKVGPANSAQTFVKKGSRTPGLGDGQGHDMTGNQRAVTTFPNVTMLDVPDLVAGRKLEVAGVWTWAMERDFDYPDSAVDNIAGTIENVLNDLIANPTPPSIDAEELVGYLIEQFVKEAGAFGVLKLLPTNWWHLTGIPDDPVGSRFYIGIGARGTLGDVVDRVVGPGGYELPAFDIPVARVPPDINGGKVFRLGSPISKDIRANTFVGSTGAYRMWFGFFEGDASTPSTTTTTELLPCEPLPGQFICER